MKRFANEVTRVESEAELEPQESAAPHRQQDNLLEEVEQTRLKELEAVITRGLSTFVEVGIALIEIRDQRLYRQVFGSFEEYCRTKWKFTRQMGYRLIEAAKVIGELSPIGDKPLPVTESAIRPLTTLKTKQDRLLALQGVTTKGGPPTAKAIQSAVDAVKASKPEVYPPAQKVAEAAEQVELVPTEIPVPPLPAGYATRKFPTFRQMLEWARTAKQAVNLESVDVSVANAINSLVAALYNYSTHAADPAVTA